MDRPADFLFFPVARQDVGHYSFIYSPNPSLITQNLNSIVLGSYKGPLVPDAIVLVSPDGDPSSTLANLRSAETETARDRLSNQTPLVYIPIDMESLNSKCHHVVFSGCAIPPDLSDIIDKRTWISSGLTHIFKENLVVHRAPPGYSFHKPSGDSSTIFLKPDLALDSSPTISFVAMAAIHRAFPSGTNEAFRLKTIYVDSMAISPVAFAIREFLQSYNHKTSITINSFHSYEGMDNIGTPIDGTSLCLISASSSLSLHDKWIREKFASPKEVITLLTLDTAREPSRALHALSLEETTTSEGPAELSIKIYGESFIPAVERPKKVLLRHEAHKIEKEANAIIKLRKEQIFDAYTVDRSSPGRPRAIHANGSRLVSSDVFNKWLDTTIPQLLRANCLHVVHQNDAASLELAKNLAERCENLSNLRPTCVPADQINPATVTPSAAILICAAISGKGSALLQISRALRDLHHGPRLYLCGLQITETQAEASTLRSNIKFRKPHPYDFVSFASLATGTQLGKSFDEELSLYRRIDLDSTNAGSSVKSRAALIGRSGYSGDQAFLPFGSNAEATMNLRLGFAFWPKTYESAPLHAEVLATIACLLQRAREEKDLSDENSLASSTFRHVLIDPENFSRYNDGVIQSSILRCAYPSELDYRSDYSSSNFIKQLVIRMISRMNSEQGEAALEFLLALGCGKLKVHAPHLLEIRESIPNSPANDDLKKFMRIISGSEPLPITGREF